MKSDLLGLAQAAQEALQSPREGDDERERGLEEGPSWEIQLRKACRFLAAAQHGLLRRPKPGFYTGVVELSFAAVERTLQAQLMNQKGFEAEDFRRHLYAIQEAGARGAIPRDVALVLEDVWFEFRNENYYRSGIAGRSAAEAMLRLAEALHAQLKSRHASLRGACICRARART